MLCYGSESCNVRITNESRFASGEMCSLRKTAEYIVKDRKELREESRFQKQENLCNYMYKTLQREN
jgi:hypothetical protein